MTPTPRDWDRVDAALAGVIAFPEVDRLVARSTALLPQNAADARQLEADAPPLRADADRRRRQAAELRDLAGDALGAAQQEFAGKRAECRRLRRQVFRLRVRLLWLRYVRPVLFGFGLVLTALPRLLWRLGGLATRPFRRRPVERVRDESDFGPRRRAES